MGANPHSYDGDIIAWANEQARLLRSGQFNQLDIEHIAEEIEKCYGPALSLTAFPNLMSNEREYQHQ